MTKFSVYAFNHSYVPDLTLISKDGGIHSPPPRIIWLSITKFDGVLAHRAHVSFTTDLFLTF